MGDADNRRSAKAGWSDNLCRRLLFGWLRQIREGYLIVEDGTSRREFGDRGAELQMTATVRIRKPQLYRRVVLGGELGLAAALIQGDAECSDLTALIRIFVRNASATDRIHSPVSLGRRLLGRLAHALRRNTVSKAKQNIVQHYDLGNDFYGLFLDETMSYSCGIFNTPDDSLAMASRNKIRRACDCLQLGPADHLLEIGTGWGELAVMAAEEYGCRVTSTTISDQQFAAANTKAVERGVSDQVTLLEHDYRMLEGQYDKIVSIEMIEAVGAEYLDLFFRRCSELLMPSGQIMIQAIVIQDAKYEVYRRGIDFIRAYIFPGGCLTSIGSLSKAASRSGLTLVALDDFAPHYAETLRRWQDNFERNWDRIEALGFDEEFMRMWQLYLHYCEAAFEERQVNLVQAVFAKREAPRFPSQSRLEYSTAAK